MDEQVQSALARYEAVERELDVARWALMAAINESNVPRDADRDAEPVSSEGILASA